MSTVTFTAPSRMYSVASCRGWNLGDLPGDCERVVLDLRKWRSVNATSAVCVVATIADLCEAGIEVQFARPRNDYANRMLNTIGFTEALSTFSLVTEPDVVESQRRVRRILPILPIYCFRTENEVEQMADDLYDRFKDHGLSLSLLQDTATVLAEAANNVVHHAQSPVGGFAIVQQRRMQLTGFRTHYIEIAVADPGRGIAASFGQPPEDAQGAIVHAMTEGVTTTGVKHRGIGLSEVARVVRSGTARGLRIHSDYGDFAITPKVTQTSNTALNRFPGTVLTVLMAS